MGLCSIRLLRRPNTQTKRVQTYSERHFALHALVRRFLISCSCVTGALLFGLLARSGIGEPVHWGEPVEPEVLKEDCMRNNIHLFEQLKEDVHEKELMRLTAADARLGRMTEPALGKHSWS